MFRRSDEGERHGRPLEAREVGMPEQSGAEVTVVGAGARLEGTIESAGSLRIDGQVKGTINAEGDVLLSPQSNVEADINAASVTVAGRFKGNIVVRNRAELAKGGRVDGNVTSKTLVIAEGASFSGQSVMEDAAAPARTAASTARGSDSSASTGSSETEPASVRR